jgi:cbb3-type cytochrome oxidase subunit 3
MISNAAAFMGLAILGLLFICGSVIAFRASRVVSLESKKKSVDLEIQVEEKQHLRDVQRLQLGMQMATLTDRIENQHRALEAGAAISEEDAAKLKLAHVENEVARPKSGDYHDPRRDARAIREDVRMHRDAEDAVIYDV